LVVGIKVWLHMKTIGPFVIIILSFIMNIKQINLCRFNVNDKNRIALKTISINELFSCNKNLTEDISLSNGNIYIHVW
jgi:hypothetical protein